MNLLITSNNPNESRMQGGERELAVCRKSVHTNMKQMKIKKVFPFNSLTLDHHFCSFSSLAWKMMKKKKMKNEPQKEMK